MRHRNARQMGQVSQRENYGGARVCLNYARRISNGITNYSRFYSGRLRALNKELRTPIRHLPSSLVRALLSSLGRETSEARLAKIPRPFAFAQSKSARSTSAVEKRQGC